ncbi:nuclear transport factor 2 family protein [Novosphingobium album (ex Hu et al. 2023)]|uniref:Nuclear transport factor 2 family protein n=1 Tax=Novosphingobium album (ex Hu et al. 2023) TaxID=2930093 RepID=A0ABT0B774_9SPHN|nr:nuclear transport factor 2 family protein [Novosphingobium album (ex Hu et al. 2023)]MCJ2180872.1 nuclear transport factor 2 family protein [Novosphingobium album (ex Hu et al. 2023)]
MPQSNLEDRFLIREVYGRYALAAAQQDGKAWLDCWSSSATWKTPHFEVSGQAALEQAWAATWTDFVNVAAFNEVGEIAVSGDTASAVSSVLEIVTLKAGGLLKMAGLYTDQFVREDGAWRFSNREYVSLSQEMSASA